MFNLNKLSTRYLILDILGQGTSGQVVRCQNMETHEFFAVKVTKDEFAYFNRGTMEVTILKSVSLLAGPFSAHIIDTL